MIIIVNPHFVLIGVIMKTSTAHWQPCFSIGLEYFEQTGKKVNKGTFVTTDYLQIGPVLLDKNIFKVLAYTLFLMPQQQNEII